MHLATLTVFASSLFLASASLHYPLYARGIDPEQVYRGTPECNKACAPYMVKMKEYVDKKFKGDIRTRLDGLLKREAWGYSGVKVLCTQACLQLGPEGIGRQMEDEVSRFEQNVQTHAKLLEEKTAKNNKQKTTGKGRPSAKGTSKGRLGSMLQKQTQAE